MFKSYLPIEYLCIDAATNYGNGLEKKTFEERIQWTKENVDLLEAFIDAADDQPLFVKSVLAIREVIKGEPTGHMISLDATCSGISILSAMVGCEAGAIATNLIDTGTRNDAYSLVTDTMNTILQQRGQAGINVPRKDAKQAIMTLTK